MADYGFSSSSSHLELCQNHLNVDSIGRQLRKSCRFCRSRKIRCSGETDPGCSACRSRNQQCIYEPTAAMGRPRKYPRTEASPTMLQRFPSTLLMPAFPPLWDDPPPGFTRQMSIPNASTFANSAPSSVAGAWKASTGDLSASLLLGSSHLPSAAPYHLSMGDLPPYSPPQAPHLTSRSSFQERNAYCIPCRPASRHHCTPSEVLLNENPSSASSSSRQHQSVTQPSAPLGFSFNPATGFNYRESFSAPPSSIAETPSEDRFDIIQGASRLLAMSRNESQSPEGHLSPDSFAEIRQLFYRSDADAIFQYFKGWALGAVTLYHLDFLLHERPNPGISDPTFEYPRMTSPGFYNTMLADFVSFITCGKSSAPDVYEPLSTSHDSLFNQMLRCDRGGNQAREGASLPSLNPLEQHTAAALGKMYSRFLEGNPFRSWFTHESMNDHGDYRNVDAALVATIVGWNLHERSQRHKENLDALGAGLVPCYMAYFEFAEEELMKRTLWETEDVLSTVQALVLLGAFRTMDGQPRCGWALLSVAHLLARQATLHTQACKRSVSSQKRCRPGDMATDSQLNGLFWLLTLVRTWTVLSLQLPIDSVTLMLLPGTRLPDCEQDGEWAGAILLDAAQLLNVFGTLKREELATNFRPRTSSEANFDSLGNWLAENARRRCQLSRLRIGRGEDPESHSTLKVASNPHANATLAVSLSILALNRNYPFRQISLPHARLPVLPPTPNTPEMLQIATSEAAGAVLAAASGTLTNPADALILRMLRSTFPYLVAILDTEISSVGEGNEIARSRLENAIEFLSSFVGAGLSLYQTEDQIVVDRLRASLMPYFPPPPLPLPCQALANVPNFEVDSTRIVSKNPASLVLTTSYSNTTSSNSSSTTLTGGTGTAKSGLSNAPEIEASRSPVEVRKEPVISNFHGTYPSIESQVSTNNYGPQPIYDYGLFPNYPAPTSPLNKVSVDDLRLLKTDESERSRSSGSSPAYSASH